MNLGIEKYGLRNSALGLSYPDLYHTSSDISLNKDIGIQFLWNLWNIPSKEVLSTSFYQQQLIGTTVKVRPKVKYT